MNRILIDSCVGTGTLESVVGTLIRVVPDYTDIIA